MIWNQMNWERKHVRVTWWNNLLFLSMGHQVNKLCTDSREARINRFSWQRGWQTTFKSKGPDGDKPWIEKQHTIWVVHNLAKPIGPTSFSDYKVISPADKSISRELFYYAMWVFLPPQVWIIVFYSFSVNIALRISPPFPSPPLLHSPLFPTLGFLKD